MGCPVPKIALRSQAGSALLKNPEKVYEIVSNVVKSVPVPVTVKIRSGWDNNSINAVEVAKVCEKAGASAIAVHGRTRSQGYSGNVDLDIIKQVKENVDIPVIGNGDIKSCYDAKKMLDYTKCDAVMIGRAALGNPWIFKECVQYLESGIIPSLVSKTEKIEMIKKHVNYLLEQKPEKVVVLEMRSHVSWYLKGIPGGAEIKRKLSSIKTIEELNNLLDNFLKETKNDGE
jgi:nifR3 family TIM-barrel protein